MSLPCRALGPDAINGPHLCLRRVVGARPGEKLQVLAGGFVVFGLAISLGGDVVAACGSTRLAVWDAVSGSLLMSARTAWGAADYRPDSCIVSIGLGGVLDPRGLGRGLPWRELPAR